MGRKKRKNSNQYQQKKVANTSKEEKLHETNDNATSLAPHTPMLLWNVDWYENKRVNSNPVITNQGYILF